MSGRLADAWDYTWAEIWQPLTLVDDAPADLFMQIYPELANALKVKPDPQTYNDATNDPIVAAEQLQLWMPRDFKGDNALARAFEAVYVVLDGIDVAGLAREFYDLTLKFLRCHNIRYRLVKPFELRPHIAGAFSALVAQVESAIAIDPHLLSLFDDFQHSLNHASRTGNGIDIRTSIAKASNFAEGLAVACPTAIGKKTFGAACNAAQCWPHEGMKTAFKSVYYFCSDFPGIRHAGRASSKLRALDRVDGIVAALLLVSSAGYFMPQLDLAEIVG